MTIVSHDLNEAPAGNNIVIMKDGLLPESKLPKTSCLPAIDYVRAFVAHTIHSTCCEMQPRCASTGECERSPTKSARQRGRGLADALMARARCKGLGVAPDSLALRSANSRSH
jgi:ABC-type proline/glycine betaine transport system ATPase subunit